MEKTGKEIKCDNCGVLHYKADWELKINKQNFCSDSCRKEYYKIFGTMSTEDKTKLSIQSSVKYTGKKRGTTEELPTKKCKECDIIFSKDATSSYEHWLSQKYCSQKCYLTSQKSLRSRVLEKDNYKCVRCSSTKDLHIHHNEYLYTDDITHLNILCSKCHSKLHRELRQTENFWRGDNKIKNATIGILEALDIDLTDPDFKNTPARVSRAFQEMCYGLKEEAKNEIKEILSTKFPSKYKGLVTFNNITVWSLCPHHLLPVRYIINVGILLNSNCIGLSKIPRLVELLARRPILQESLTQEVVTILDDNLDTYGTICVIKGMHTCMQARGAKVIGSEVLTSSATKEFLHPKGDTNPRDEFFFTVNQGNKGE